MKAYGGIMNSPQITGIIAEYDPFHNGHLYQMRKARSLSGASWCVAVLSGHFTERGEPAVYDPFLRAEAALRAGADAVFEIPAPFSTASARDYAEYGVKLLSRLGAGTVACGTEDATAEELKALMSLVDESSPVFTETLRKGLVRGLSYPEARIEAITEDLAASGAGSGFLWRTRSILASPNNILASEYARALAAENTSDAGPGIRLVTVQRVGAGYHDPFLRGEFASATAVRRQVFREGGVLRPDSAAASYVPGSVLSVLSGTPMLSPDCFAGPAARRIMDLCYEGADLSVYQDVSGDLAERIRNTDLRADSWEGLAARIKTRQYTHTRVSRALLHIFLGIRKTDVLSYKDAGTAPYARLIGFRRESADLLTALKASSRIPVISKAADAGEVLKRWYGDTPRARAALRLLGSEAHAADLWNSVCFEQTGRLLPPLYARPMIVV